MATSTSYAVGGEQNIPLRRLPSSASSKNASSILSNPFSDPDTNGIITNDDRSSINHALLPHPDVNNVWKPDHIIRIDSIGLPFLTLPFPVSQLEIPIFSLGSEGAERQVYQSVRGQRRSGNCSLFAAPGIRGDEGGVGRELARTTYVWGPGKDPVVCVFHVGQSSSELPEVEDGSRSEADEFPISSTSLWNRTQSFVSKRWGRFEWRFAGRAERKTIAKLRGDGREINSLLVLERIESSSAGTISKDARKTRVAMLIRGDGTRSEGTKARDSGNGGVLELCLGGSGERSGSADNDANSVDLIDEVTVLVTCLVMLKKEVDRARGRKIAMIGAAASGGGS